MTTAIAREVGRRRGKRPKTLAASLSAACMTAALAAGVGSTGYEWPSTKYRDNPVAFFREVLGVEPWTRQVEIIEAIRDHKRVAVSAGHKVSKSHTFAGAALWFYCSFSDARVVMSSTTSRQVDQILWRELRMMHARTKIPIGGRLGELARSGLKSTDFREIVGFTAREAEAVAGISGKNLLYLIDEASGVPDIIFEAIEGNRAGGARVALFSNPTKTEGEFFEAFHGKSQFYETYRISSEESPNVITGREVIPGLATREWIEEKREEWGADSAQYLIRVKGEHALNEDGKIISVHDVAEAEGRWAFTPAAGRLQIGLDPAGPGEGGDESVFAPRRGNKVLALRAYHGLNDEAHLAHLLGIIEEFGLKREQPPIVVVDREGPIGSRLYGTLRSYVDQHTDAFFVVGVRSSDKARRRADLYERVRDELWANLSDWIRDEGAIPEDAKLAKDIHAPEWHGQISGKLKATPKRELKKALGRSPDRGDAVCLAVWPTAVAKPVDTKPKPRPVDTYERAARGIDPYQGVDWS